MEKYSILQDALSFLSVDLDVSSLLDPPASFTLDLDSLFSLALTASKSFTKSRKSDGMILFTRGPQKGALEETEIYSVVIGRSVSQVAGTSPFCRAVKVFLVQE